ncbi:MAG: hypothetical protein GWN29_04895 [Gammaproteobacteria bacterium]|nr:hypothetical protein [Gammaproteobacteria bacterium]
METLDATGEKLSVVIGENQKLIGSTLIEWVSSVGQALITGIVKPAQWIVQAWKGWGMIIDAVQGVLGKFLGWAVEHIGKVLPMLADMAGAAGFDGVAESMRNASKQTAELSKTLNAWGEEGFDAIHTNSVELEEMQRTLEDLERQARKTFDEGVVQSQKRVAEATVGSTKTLDEQREALARYTQQLDDVNQRIDDFIAKRQRAREQELARQEKDARSLDAQGVAEKGEEQVNTVAAAALTALGDVGDAIIGGIQGGLAGVAASIVGSVLSRSKELEKQLVLTNEMFVELAEAVAPLIEGLSPLVIMVGELVSVVSKGLHPVFEAFGDVTSELTFMIVNILTAFGGLWNGLVNALARVFDTLGKVKIFGERVFGWAHDWAEGIRDAAIDLSGLDEMRREMENGADAMADGTDAINEATRDIVSSLTNVPSGVKVALARFRATDAEMGGVGDVATEAARDTSSQSVPDDFQGGMLPATVEEIAATAAGANTITQIENLSVVAPVATLEEIIAQSREEAERQGSATDGALAPPVYTPAEQSALDAARDAVAGGFALP